MKKLAAIIVLCTLSTMTMAQHKLKGEKNSHEKRQELKIQKLEAELNLTPLQVKEIEAIDEKYAPVEKQHREKREALRQEIKKTNIQKREEMKLVLTPEQLKLLEEKKSERKERAHEHKKEQIVK